LPSFEVPSTEVLALMSETSPPDASRTGTDGFNLIELIPDLLERYFEFFKPGHQEGVVPSRIKELARLKVAELNDCDT
jgi:hypothetical protein